MKLIKNRVGRVLRGGGFDYIAGGLRVSLREWLKPEDRGWNLGFRFVIRGMK